MTERIFQAKDRTFTRTQGCWNCKHSSSANVFWSERRQQDLQTALGLAQQEGDGEENIKVYNIRKMVDRVDHLVAAGQLKRCTTGRQANGDPVGDLVQHSYLCDRWDAAQGASMARDVGKTDMLPEELVEKVDAHKPTDLKSLLGRKIVT